MELSRKNQLPTAALTPLMTIARRYERVSDQAKNLCEEVLYMCTGEFAKHKGGDAFRILFFDMSNACLSQMAEGLGNAMRLPRFVFSSAGAVPQPVDARAVKFMADKGIDISGQTSKALEQVSQWEQYQVVVALGSPGAAGFARAARQDHLVHLVSQGPRRSGRLARRCAKGLRVGLPEPRSPHQGARGRDFGRPSNAYRTMNYYSQFTFAASGTSTGSPGSRWQTRSPKPEGRKKPETRRQKLLNLCGLAGLFALCLLQTGCGHGSSGGGGECRQ